MKKIKKALYPSLLCLSFEASSFTSSEFHYWKYGYIYQTFSQNVADALEGIPLYFLVWDDPLSKLSVRTNYSHIRGKEES